LPLLISSAFPDCSLAGLFSNFAALDLAVNKLLPDATHEISISLGGLMSDLCKVNTLCLCDPRIKDVHLDTHKGTKMFFSKRGFFVMAGARDTGVVVYDESGNMVKVLEKGQELRGLHAQHPDLGTNMNYPTMPLHFEGLPKSANAKDVEVILDWSAVLMAGVHTLAVYLTALGSHEDKESVYEFRSVGVVAGKVLMGGLAMDDGETILTIRAVTPRSTPRKPSRCSSTPRRPPAPPSPSTTTRTSTASSSPLTPPS
jgi:hypothetical protein